MNRGKKKCEILKTIRCQVAKKNGIPYTYTECTYQGECRGTCPKCEEELCYLTRELEKLKQSGKQVAVAGVAAAVIATSTAGCSSDFLADLGLEKQQQIPSVSVAPTPTPEPVLTPSSEPKPSPEPMEPSYDPLTDPNVYWGTELDRCPVFGYINGHIWKGSLLDEVLLQAEDDQLIAFYIFGSVLYWRVKDQYFPNINVKRMSIPEELDRGGLLTNLVFDYSHAETQEARCNVYGEIQSFFGSVYDEWTTRLDAEEARIRAELYLEIAKERGFDPDAATWAERRFAESEVTRRIENAERYGFYRSEREEVESWSDLRRKFLLQFDDFYIEDMRQVMIDRGFIPIYETLAENPLPERTEGSFFGTFIGTAKQIKEAEVLIEDYEAYIFDLAIKP